MANYTIAVSWSGKDALSDSDAAKVISGADFNTEFTAVQTAINTKADLNGSASESFSATTATEGTNTTQVASTAFVTTAIASHKTATEAARTNGFGLRTVSTSAASGGSNGDIWYQVAS